jgi:hypothetical protein
VILGTLQAASCFFGLLLMLGMCGAVCLLARFGGAVSDAIGNPAVKIVLRGARRRWF